MSIQDAASTVRQLITRRNRGARRFADDDSVPGMAGPRLPKLKNLDEDAGDVHVDGLLGKKPKDDSNTDNGPTQVDGLLGKKPKDTEKVEKAVELGDPGEDAASQAGMDRSYEALRDAIQCAIDERYGTTGDCGPCAWICETYEDRVIYQGPDGQYFQVSYTIADDGDGDGDIDVDLGDIVPVRSVFQPVRPADQSDDVSGADPETGDGAAVIAKAASGDLVRVLREHKARLFIDARKRLASEAPQWMPVLPLPGSYQHPSYGDIRITRERNARFVRNFNSGVYQSQVAVDAEHNTKESGAVGWITILRLNEDGSADGKVEWTTRGTTLLAEDAFKYVSPEWYDEWTDPATGKVYQDVLVGAAITTRPFFKENALRPLVASEGRLFTPRPGSRPDGEDVFFDALPRTTAREGKPMSVDARAFAEMQERVKKIEAERDAHKRAAENAHAQAKQASERVAAIERGARSKRFTDEILGRSEANNLRWFGEPEKHVTMLDRLADTFGEDSEEVRQYVEVNRTAASQMRESGAFREIGRAGAGGSDAASKAKALANKKMTERVGLTEIDALAQVFNENPSLYREYREQSTVRAR